MSTAARQQQGEEQGEELAEELAEELLVVELLQTVAPQRSASATHWKEWAREALLHARRVSRPTCLRRA